MAKLRLLTLSLIPVFAFGQQNATAASNVTTEAPTTTPAKSTPTRPPSTTQSPTSLSDDSMDYELPNFMTHIPPWGESAFGGFDRSSFYRPAGLLDIRRDGWSWTPSYLHKSAPFCYDTSPRPFSAGSYSVSSTCYTGGVATMCKALGGTSSYQDTICIEDPAMPFDVVGPVCWNQTCYNEATFKACTALGGQFVGSARAATDGWSYDGMFFPPFSGASWCAVPGQHTIVGPACYGEICFTEELAKGCAALGGTNFADIFCLLDDSYTVVGPICKPTLANNTEDAIVCFPEETAKLCLDMGGTNIGDIFCVIKGGNYSVLGPFCNVMQYFDFPHDVTDNLYYPTCTDGSDVCREIGGNPLGEGTFCVVNGDDYVAVGPLCFSAVCNGLGGMVSRVDDAVDKRVDGGLSYCEYYLGGTNIGNLICLLKGAFSVVGPMNWGNVQFSGNVFADTVNASQAILHSVSSWVILNGTFSVYGPTCYGSNCNDGDCLAAGGSSFGGVFCAVQEGPAATAAGQQEGPASSTSEVQRTSGLLTTATTVLLCMLV
jgi:hypothetical protein